MRRLNRLGKVSLHDTILHTTMKHLLQILMLVLGVTSVALADDVFPGQPRVSAAYNKVSAAITELDKASRDGVGKHVENALTLLGEADVQLELVAKNKGSAPTSARKLIKELRDGLSVTPMTSAKLE